MKTILLVLIAFLLSGCVGMKPLNMTPQSMSAVNEIAAFKLVYVEFAGNRSAVAENLKIDNSTTTWLDPDSGKIVSIPTENIENIKTAGPIHRPKNKFGMGVLAGSAFGVMFGLSSGGSASDQSTYAVLGGMGFGLVGGFMSQMFTGNMQRSSYQVIWTNPDIQPDPRSISW